MDSSNFRRRLMWHGILLFLLGLLTGFVIPNLTNPHMGVSAHLNAVMGGEFLVSLGLIWRELRSSPKAAAAIFWIAIIGMYINWTFTLLGGIFGTSKLTPVAGSGFSASAWQENLIAAGLIPMTLSMVVCLVLVLRGLGGPSPVERG
jgi:hydroxylaminobenzene mutase